MASRNEQEKTKQMDEKTIKRMRRGILLLLTELALCLFLGSVAVIAARTVNAVTNEELGEDLFVATRKPGTQKTVQDVTNEAGEVIGRQEIEIPMENDDSDYRNILVIGVDQRPQFSFDENGTNTDVMIIASINNKTGEIKLVSVYRDTIMKLEERSSIGAYSKANSQYYSGITDTVSMMNRNLDLDIREYVIVNWYGVAVCVNQLGGIEMTIKDEHQLSWFNGYLTAVNNATGIWAPQLSAPGTYLMSGTQVVAYCRIRYGGLNDTGRTSNQREAINKMLEKAKGILKSGDVSKILEIAETALGNVKTNLKLPEIIYLATYLDNYQIVGSRGFPVNYTSDENVGNYRAKYGIDWPIVANDFAAEVKDLHLFLFNETDYVPSDFIKQISYQMYLDRTGQQ